MIYELSTKKPRAAEVGYRVEKLFQKIYQFPLSFPQLDWLSSKHKLKIHSLLSFFGTPYRSIFLGYTILLSGF